MSLWSLLGVLLTLSSIVDAAWPFKVAEQLSTAPITGTLSANLKQQATFVLNHSQPIQLCLQETFPTPLNLTTWANGCTFYFSFPAGALHTGSLPLRQSNYNLAIYFGNDVPAGTTDQISLEIGIEGDSCPENQIFDTNTQLCVATTNAAVGLTQLNFTANVTIFLKYTLPNAPILTGSFKVSGPNNIVFAARRAGAPSTAQGFFDGTSGQGAANVTLPRLGSYYLYLVSSVDQVANVSITVEDCTNSARHGGGPGCSLIYEHDHGSDDLRATDKLQYWMVTASPDDALRVSVGSNDGSPLPRLYASRGQIPQPGNADITGCNQVACGTVSFIEFKSQTNEVWYVAVRAAEGFNDTSYGIWFDSVCSPACAHNGQCTIDGPTTGLCVCNQEGDSGVGCQVSNALSRQYIVLAAIWATAAALTIVVVLFQVLTSSKDTYERLT